MGSIRKSITIGVFFLIGFTSCTEKRSSSNEIRIRLDEFPETFIPLNYTSTEAGLILEKVYNFPELIDNRTLLVTPGVATLLNYYDSSSRVVFKYKVRDSLEWNNGLPVGLDDFETTFKVNNIKGIDNEWARLSFSFIRDFIVRDSKNGVFDLQIEGNGEAVRERVGSFFLLPKHLYDPENILDEVNLSNLLNDNLTPNEVKVIDRYIKFYDSDSFRESLERGGSGPYEISSWVPGQSITLKKEVNWWGNELKEENLANYIEQIRYDVISDESVALLALKNGTIDVMGGISPSAFLSLVNDNDYKDRFHALTPISYQFVYLGINSRLQKLGPPVRKALAQLIPYDQLIESAALGFASRTVGPINPADDQYYNRELIIDSYDESEARNSLEQAGFVLKNEKIQSPSGTPLTFELSYPLGSDIFESSALIIKESFENAGITIGLKPVERSVLIKEAKAHNFELFLSSFRGGPLAHNFAPLFHTEAANVGGLNFSGFGSQRSDSVINLINNAPKKSVKINALKELQRMLQEERTMLFLFFEKDRIAVSKRFKNVYGFSSSPGYDVTKFQIANPN